MNSGEVSPDIPSTLRTLTPQQTGKKSGRLTDRLAEWQNKDGWVNVDGLGAT